MPGQDAPSRTHLHRLRAGEVLFAAPAVLATLLDVWWAMPTLEIRENGHHFTLWGWLHTTTGALLLVMGAAWLIILLQRRRWPMGSHVAIVAASALMTFSSASAQPIAGTLLTLYAVARVARLRTSLVALALGIGVLSMGPFWYDLPSPLALVAVEASMWVTCVATWLFGRRERRAVDREARLRGELVALGEQAATIGPRVEPGETPCLACVDQARTAADPSWPAIEAQLWGQEAHADAPMLATEAAIEVLRVLCERDSASVRIDAVTGRRHRRSWSPSARCGCRGLELGLPPVALGDRDLTGAAGPAGLSAARPLAG